MFQMLRGLRHEALMFIVLRLFKFTSSQNTDVLFDSVCAESGEMCGEVSECCADLKCDVNEPVARCVDAREVNSQADEFASSGQASVEQENTTSAESFIHNTTQSSKLKYLKDKIMNFFKDDVPDTSTEELILSKKDLFAYRLNFKPTTMSPFERLRNLFVVNGMPSSSETNELA